MKKTLNVYYKGICQKIKYFGDIDIEQTKQMIKELFNIKENLNQIYFQDEEGDPIILNKNIPSELSVHIYIKPEAIPSNPENAIKINDSVLNSHYQKFYWIFDPDGESDHENSDISNKYIYKNKSSSGNSKGNVRSSISFKEGISFFVLRVGNFPHYSYLNIVDEGVKFSINNEYDIKYTNIGLGGSKSMNYVRSNEVYNIGILIDMNKKRCVFYDYDKKEKIKCLKDTYSSVLRDGKNEFINMKEGEPLEGNILSNSVKVIAWIKGESPDENSGISILNEGCIPIPDWVKV